MQLVDEQHDDVAAAKAKLVEAASKIDFLAPLRDKPWTTVAAAGAGGAILATGGKAMGDAAELLRAVADMARTVERIIERARGDEPEA